MTELESDRRARHRRDRLVRTIKRMLPTGGHPARAVFAGFAGAILFGAVLLMLPIATESGDSTGFIAALFTSTSAVCVTGLIVVDTPTHWSTFGEVVIMALFQVGGIGIMTLASLLGVLVSRRLGLRMQLTAQAETKSLGLGDVRKVISRVIKISLAVEAVLAIVLTIRLLTGYDSSFGHALYSGVFHAISAFNNAGFSIYSDSLMRFAADPWISIPIAVAVIVGGIGFPVLFEVARRAWRPRHWSLHSKLTLLTTGVLLVVGFVFITAVEWGNPKTMGSFGVGGKLLSGFFTGVMPRTAGFNTLDVAGMHPATLLVQDVLMFIGGGSAGTAGGIKVTTFVLLFFVIFAEVRGEHDVVAFGRRVAPRAIRQALTVALLAVGAVVASTFAILQLSAVSTEDALFEVVSALATVGLSTGITADLPTAAQLVLTLLMFVGRLGPITLVSALAVREQTRLHRLPEGRPLIG